MYCCQISPVHTLLERISLSPEKETLKSVGTYLQRASSIETACIERLNQGKYRREPASFAKEAHYSVTHVVKVSL